MPSKKAKAKAKSKSKASSQSQSQSLPPTINTSATNVDASANLNPPSSPTSSLPESRARTTLPPTSLPPSTELPVPPITVPSQNNQHIQAEPFSPPYFHHPEHDQAKSQNRSPDVASGGGGEGGGNAQPPSFLWTGDDSDGQGTPLNAADAELLETANRWYASTMQHLAEQEQQLRQHGRDQSSQQHDSHPHQHPPFTDEELFQILDAGFAASGGDLAASQLASRIISDKLFGAGAGVGIGGGASYAAAGTLDEEYWDSPHPHIRNLAQLMYSKIAQKHGQSTFPTGPTNSNPTAHSAHTPKSDNPNANRGSTQSKTPHPPFPLPGEFTFMATTGTTTTPSGEYETLSGGHGKSGQKGPVQYKMTASTMLPADPSLFSDPAMIKSIQDAAAALVSLPLPFPVSQHTIHTAEGAKVVIENAQSFEMSTTLSEGVKHVGRVQHQSIPQHGMGVVTGQMTLPVPMTVDGSGGVGSGTAVVAGGHVSITAETHGNATRKRDIKGKGRAEPAEVTGPQSPPPAMPVAASVTATTTTAGRNHPQIQPQQQQQQQQVPAQPSPVSIGKKPMAYPPSTTTTTTTTAAMSNGQHQQHPQSQGGQQQLVQPPRSARAASKQPATYAQQNPSAAAVAAQQQQPQQQQIQSQQQNHAHPHHHPSPTPSSNTSKSRNNKGGSNNNNNSSSNVNHNANSSTKDNNKIWSTSSTEERERIKDFWLGLGEEERRNLVKIEKDTVLRKMKEQQKHSCSCAVCGRKRNAIEEELEVLYDAYYEELEQYANYQQRYVSSGGTLPPPPGPGPFPGSVDVDEKGVVIGSTHPHPPPPPPNSRQMQHQQYQQSGRVMGKRKGKGVVQSMMPPTTKGQLQQQQQQQQQQHLQHHHQQMIESEFDDDEGEEEEEYEEEEEEEDDEEYEDEDEEEEEEEEEGYDGEDDVIGNGKYPQHTHPQRGQRGPRVGQRGIPGRGRQQNGPAKVNGRDGIYNFKNSLAVTGNILTVADDLLKNDGQKFLEMMEQLAERRMQREEEAAAELERDSEEEDEEDGEGSEDEEEDEEEEDEEDEEDEEEEMTEEQRVEEGKRMFSIFAARMFEQRVLQAYREKVARERQLQLLRELEAEDQLSKEREAKKQTQNQKKKDKKRQQKQQKEEERAQKAAERAAEEAAAKARQAALEEEQRRKREEERTKREAARKAAEEERQRKEEEKRKRIQEEKEREAAERERKKKEKEERQKREREERERKAKEEKERKAKEEKERKAREEKEAKEKAEREEKERAAAAEKAKAEAEAQRKAKEKEAKEREAREREAKEREARERETREREAKEAREREAAQQKEQVQQAAASASTQQPSVSQHRSAPSISGPSGSVKQSPSRGANGSRNNAIAGPSSSSSRLPPTVNGATPPKKSGGKGNNGLGPSMTSPAATPTRQPPLQHQPLQHAHTLPLPPHQPGRPPMISQPPTPLTPGIPAHLNPSSQHGLVYPPGPSGMLPPSISPRVPSFAPGTFSGFGPTGSAIHPPPTSAGPSGLAPSALPRNFSIGPPYDPAFPRGAIPPGGVTPIAPPKPKTPLAASSSASSVVGMGTTPIHPGRRSSVPIMGGDPGPVARPPIAPIARPTTASTVSADQSGSGTGSPVRRSPSPKGILGSSALAADDDEVVPATAPRRPVGPVGSFGVGVGVGVGVGAIGQPPPSWGTTSPRNVGDAPIRASPWGPPGVPGPPGGFGAIGTGPIGRPPIASQAPGTLPSLHQPPSSLPPPPQSQPQPPSHPLPPVGTPNLGGVPWGTGAAGPTPADAWHPSNNYFPTQFVGGHNGPTSTASPHHGGGQIN